MNRTAFATLTLFFASFSSSFGEDSRGRILDRNENVLAETVDGTRSYPMNESCSHLTGFLSIGENPFGVIGLEKSLNETLSQGKDITLTIDARIQKIAAEVFPEGKDGAVVVIEPNTGAILALNSFPGFEPNDFPTITEEKFRQYNDDERRPLLNRALHPSPPGSTYKIPVALATGLADFKDTPYTCEGGVQYGKKFIKCWIAPNRHGDLDLSTAIKHSCNAYFYQVSNVIGIDTIEKTVDLLGLTEATGCGLNEESSGTIATPAFLQKRGLQWSDAFTAMTAIGQGFTEATPLQMASMTATVANGGRVYQSHLVQPDEPNLKADLTKEGFSAEHIELVRKAMWRIVNEPEGTGSNAKTEAVEIAGKTGTPQTGDPQKPRNAWFIAFAPYENPSLAICVFVENGVSGGRTAAPLAREILTRSLTLDSK